MEHNEKKKKKKTCNILLHWFSHMLWQSGNTETTTPFSCALTC